MTNFSKALTETKPLEKPKNLETIAWNMVCQWKFFKNSEVLNIVEKVIKCGIRWWFYGKHL